MLLITVVTHGQDSNSTADAFKKALQLKDSIEMSAVALDSVNTGYSPDLLNRSNEYKFMHQQRSFNWQYHSGIIIFFMVIVIVILGMVLSYKQFKLNERLLNPVKTAGNTLTDIKSVSETSTISNLSPGEVFATNTMEISKDGIKISTAVIGLIILTLSIAFFFLYLKYVYPISFVE